MKPYIRCKQHKIYNTKTKTIRTTTEVSHWNDQQNKITGGFKSILQVHNLTLRFRSGSQN